MLGADPAPWRPADTILVAYSMFLNLNDERADRDLKRGLAHRVLSTEVFDFMYPQGTSWDAPLMGDSSPLWCGDANLEPSPPTPP